MGVRPLRGRSETSCFGVADGEGDVDGRVVAGAEGEVALLVAVEAGDFDDEVIGAGFEELEVVFADVVGLGVGGDSGGLFGGDDFDVGDGAAGGVFDGAGDGGGRDLGEGLDGAQAEGKEKAECDGEDGTCDGLEFHIFT
jgi:hypothetical protein